MKEVINQIWCIRYTLLLYIQYFSPYCVRHLHFQLIILSVIHFYYSF